jgi:hypothetical protein
MAYMTGAGRGARAERSTQATHMLRRFIEAVESEELAASTPLDPMVVELLRTRLRVLEAIADRA